MKHPFPHFSLLSAATRCVLSLLVLTLTLLTPHRLLAQATYTPTPECLESRQEFADMKFGIFLHWGIYSMFGQGEWYMQNANLDWREYQKAASAFYPHLFNADEWVQAIKASGARYITFTSRHHDSFSMWRTEQSDYNIVDATPFGRDVVGELADACHRQGIRLHLYYSHLDWRRADYPLGRTGHGTHRDLKPCWDTYLQFMEGQLTELLTRYGAIGAIWFDGVWDHDSDSIPFDWDLDRQYALIHRLQPRCLVGNNHHQDVNPGEDIQIFERDVPGQNLAGYSGDMQISQLPLETCQTMNGMWGYKITDQDYKSTDELIHLLISTSGKGANLLLNIGPQPNGQLPATALDRLREMGQWLSVNGETIYGTRAGDVAEQSWGASTRRGEHLYLHVTDPDVRELTFTLPVRVVKAASFADGSKLTYRQLQDKAGHRWFVTIQVPEHTPTVDYIIDLVTR